VLTVFVYHFVVSL